MLEAFIAQGSVLAVALLAYARCVMIEANKRAHLNPIGAHPVILHPISTIVMLASVPITPLSAIYVGWYAGWVAGAIAWVGLQVISAIAVSILWIKSPILGLHFMASCLALIAGLFLIIQSLVM